MSVLLSEEQLLLRKHEAEALLQTVGRGFTRVIRVTIDAILYLNPLNTPMTAWIDRHDQDGIVTALTFVPGFPAIRHAGTRVQIDQRPAPSVGEQSASG